MIRVLQGVFKVASILVAIGCIFYGGFYAGHRNAPKPIADRTFSRQTAYVGPAADVCVTGQWAEPGLPAQLTDRRLPERQVRKNDVLSQLCRIPGAWCDVVIPSGTFRLQGSPRDLNGDRLIIRGTGRTQLLFTEK